VENTGCDSHKAEWRTKVPGAENRKVSTHQESKEKKREESQVERGGRKARRAPVGG